MDLFVGIIGWGDITYANAARLLDDFLPAEPEVVVSFDPDTKQPGMTNVIAWMDKVHQDYTLSSHSDIMDRAAKNDSVIIVLSTDYLGAEIARAKELEIPVLDLTRALYPVTDGGKEGAEVPAGGAESHAETLPEQSPVTVQQELEAAVRGDLSLTEGAVKKLIEEAIRMHEAQYHPRQYIDGQPWKPTAEAPVETSEPAVQADGEATETYYLDESKGTYRKKGRRKIKPGETEVELTAQQVTDAGDKVVS